MSGFNNTRDCLWFVSKHEVEWGFASGRMRAVIMNKFGHRDMFGPGFKVRAAEDAEVSLNLLIESFRFFIGLGVVSVETEYREILLLKPKC